MQASEPEHLLHTVSDPDRKWTRVNAAESFPGVATPLAWDYFGKAYNKCFGLMLVDLGLAKPGERLPLDAQDGYADLFYGRSAIDLARIGVGISRFPNNLASDHAREILSDGVGVPGSTESATESDASIKIDLERYRARVACIRDVVRADHDSTLEWWQRETAPERIADRSNLRERYHAALDVFMRVMTDHCTNSTLCQQYFSQAAKLCDEAGAPDLASKLTTGFGDTIDVCLTDDLWAVSRGRKTLDDVVATYGYQSSYGDDIAAKSWREDAAPIAALVKNYAKMPNEKSPHTSAEARAKEREQAERTIIQRLPPERREAARSILEELKQSTIVRELGKASYKIANDVVRAVCRAHGEELARTGVIETSGDVYFLSVAEAFDGAARDFRKEVDERRKIFERYLEYDLPNAWTGNPTPISKSAVSDADENSNKVLGIGASAGKLEGRVRRVLNHAEAEPMEPGEVLVANTTDPSWGPFFVLAGALVIDVGGKMSHGAIIARELGIPCVINTKDGSKRLKDGDLVEVDGDEGVVTIMQRS